MTYLYLLFGVLKSVSPGTLSKYSLPFGEILLPKYQNDNLGFRGKVALWQLDYYIFMSEWQEIDDLFLSVHP
ncbi:hypothetical protein M2137_002656 [Parabacteroides sp. PFB2-10]|nr:hypothetical protein [Parabacteroides sp. PFB2-10]